MRPSKVCGPGSHDRRCAWFRGHRPPAEPFASARSRGARTAEPGPTNDLLPTLVRGDGNGNRPTGDQGSRGGANKPPTNGGKRQQWPGRHGAGGPPAGVISGDGGPGAAPFNYWGYKTPIPYGMTGFRQWGIWFVRPVDPGVSASAPQ